MHIKSSSWNPGLIGQGLAGITRYVLALLIVTGVGKTPWAELAPYVQMPLYRVWEPFAPRIMMSVGVLGTYKTS